MLRRKKSYFDNSAPDIKNRRKQPCSVRYMASIQQFFVTLNAATPDLFARFHKRTDRQKVASSYKPVRSNAAERAKKVSTLYEIITMALCKTAVTPLLMHWSYCSLVLSYIDLFYQFPPIPPFALHPPIPQLCITWSDVRWLSHSPPAWPPVPRNYNNGITTKGTHTNQGLTKNLASGTHISISCRWVIVQERRN